jgi:hypothetical protein
MLICSICGIDFWPTGRWHDEWCDGCHTGNFAGSQELRLHAPDPSVQALTPRQTQARQRAIARWAQEDE